MFFSQKYEIIMSQPWVEAFVISFSKDAKC